MYKLKIKKIIAAIFALALIAPAFTGVKAAAGSLVVRTDDPNPAVGDEFAVGIRATSDVDINAIGAELVYPSDLLEVKDVSGPSVITLFITKGVVSAGTVTIEGGIQPAMKVSNDRVGVITFHAKKAGKATLAIAGSSGLYANDGSGTNILASRGSLDINIGEAPTTAPAINPPPGTEPAIGAPTIVSATHPDENAFYNDRTISVAWNAPGADAYQYDFDQVLGETPDGAGITSGATSGEFTATNDGIWYLHVRAEKNNKWGTAAEMKFNIDTFAPSVTLSLSKDEILSNGSTAVTFSASDDFSGVAGFEIAAVKDNETPVWKKAVSPVILKDLQPGNYAVMLRATDNAGNAATLSNPLTVGAARGLAALWTNWWAQAVFVVLLGMICGAVFVLIVKRLQGNNKKKLFRR